MLHNLLVVETASVLAGPLAGQFLAELGARVIKLENATTGGDVTRSWRTSGEEGDTDISAYFACANFGKESVRVDLRRPEDRHLTGALIAAADVFIHNWKPGDDAKLGFDYEHCIAMNPRIVHASISGYGEDDRRVGYDAVIQAESGLMSMNGSPDSGPTKMPVAVADIMAAHQLKQGILVALLHRERTGEGSKVHVSLMESALSSLVNQGTNYLHTGRVPGREGSEHPNIVPYGTVFLTADHAEILLAVGTDDQYADLCAVLGVDVRPMHASNHGRVKDRHAVNVVLRSAIRSIRSDELLAECKKRKIPAGMVEPVDRALDGPQGRGMILQSETIKGIRSSVARISSLAATTTLSRPPHLDEHGERVRAEFMGTSDDSGTGVG